MNLSDAKTKSIGKERYKIAIQIDYPNIDIGLKKSGWPEPFDYEVIEKFAKQKGEIILSKIYGDWNYLSMSSKCLSQFEVELVDVPHVQFMGKGRKDTVDTKMAMDAGMMLYEYPEIDMVIMVSGDADFIPVIKRLKQFKSMKVIIIGDRESISDSIGRIADQTLFYQYIAKID